MGFRRTLALLGVLVCALGLFVWCYLNPAQRASSQIARGDAQLILGQFQEAEHFYRRAAELNPESFRPWQRLARCQERSQISFREADLNYQKALELAPDNLENLLLYAQYLYLDERYQESRQMAFRALSLEPICFEAMVRVADCEIHLGHMERAKRWHRRVLSFNPHFHMSLFALAKIAAHEDKDEEAIQLYRQSMGVSGGLDQRALDAIADLLLQNGRPEELIALQRDLFARRSILPETAAGNEAKLAAYYNAQGDKERAYLHLRAIVTTAPQSELAAKTRRFLRQHQP